MMLLKQFPDQNEFEQLAAAGCNVIPLCAEVLADTETPVSVLKKFYRAGQPAFLLESVEGGERWGRYSFLGTSAQCHVRIFPDQVAIDENGTSRSIDHHGDPLNVLREFMAHFKPAPGDGLPRFWGGLVGYLTYEMVSFFEAIANRYPVDKPLAHFIIPDRLMVFDNIGHTLLCVAVAFMDGTRSPAQAYRDASGGLNHLLATLSTPLPASSEPLPAITEALCPVHDDESYRVKVRTTKDYIRAGDIIQAVISQPFTYRGSVDPVGLYQAQRYVNPSPYLYFLNLEELTLVGSSPETMVRLENQVATLRPIAGTRPRGGSQQQDRALADELLGDEKERAEHLMLVDLGRNDLGRIASTGTVQVTDLMVVERYSHVMHLVSNISCELKSDRDAWDLLRASFPAGTLSGAPKVRAMEIIAELETEPRGPYGGAVGYISFSGNMDLAITIRTACLEKDVLTVRAGAGIVADSDPERERVETVNKAMAIQRALELLR
jgi:anthranilate synthase component 1